MFNLCMDAKCISIGIIQVIQNTHYQMSKNIKEPFLIFGIAKCNTIPANLQQSKEPYEEKNYDSNNVTGKLCCYG